LLFQQHTTTIRSIANRLGFDYCGIAKAEKLDEDARRLESWLKNGFNGSMQYMENHFDLRTDPRKLFPGAKSVITLLKNYYPSTPQSIDSPKVSKYAYGEDYHEVIRKQLKQFLHEIKQEIGEVNGRGFVDSAPILERAWAVKSGLGWIGKNGNLINKNSGSFFFIATLITDLNLLYDSPFAKDYCGSCRKCIEACPTEAIMDNKVVDGSKCISYYTIELKEMLMPADAEGKLNNWMFGCDACMDVCPWNRFSQPHHESAFTPIPAILNFTTNDWNEMTEETFKEIFRHSPLKRSKFSGIKRNLKALEINIK